MAYKRLSLWLLTAAICIAAFLVPLVVKTELIRVPPPFLLLGYPNPVRDGFAFTKAVLLVISGSIAVLGLITSKIRLDRDEGVLLCLMLLTGLSSAFSPYKGLSLWGVPFLFEGLPVWLAYLALCMAAKRLPEALFERVVSPGIAASALVISGLGLSEAAGYPLLNHPLVAAHLLNAGDGQIAVYAMQFAAAAIPFGNPNYTGMYAAMIWPFLLGQSFGRRSSLGRFGMAAVAAAVFALLMASLNRGGWIAAGCAVLAGLIALILKKWREKKSGSAGPGASVHPKSFRLLFTGALVLLHACAYFAIDHITVSRTTARIATVPPQFTAATFTPNPPSAALAQSATASISKVMVDDGSGRLRIEGSGPEGAWILRIERQSQSVKFMDESFQPLAFIASPDNTGAINLIDKRFAGLVMVLRQGPGIRILSIQDIDVAITNWGFRIGRGGAFITPVAAQRFPLPLSDNAFSYRGFIWAYSLPLLRDTLVLGHGPGSFPFDFPNNDPVKMSEIFGADSIVDKPHNFFISFAHTHGVIALTLLCYLGARCLLATARGNDEAALVFRYSPSLPLLMSILGYLIAGLSVDSTVGVSALFWILFGQGLAQGNARESPSNDCS